MNIEISIAGAFCHYNDILKLYTKYSKLLKNNLVVYDAYNDSVWNGCRTFLEAPTHFDLTKLRTYNKLGIGVAITFSNDIIDVSLPDENKVLFELNKSPLNSVIIVNEDLYKHIKKNYKNLKVMYSVSGFPDLNFKNIKSLEQKYDKICPRYELVFNPKFYNFVDVSKYKIMMNDTCKWGCTLWDAHFKAVNKLVREKCNDWSVIEKTRFCVMSNEHDNPDNGWQKNKDKFGDNLGMDLNANAVANALKIGYRSFKISGREFKEEFFSEVAEQLNIISEGIKLYAKNSKL